MNTAPMPTPHIDQDKAIDDALWKALAITPRSEMPQTPWGMRAMLNSVGLDLTVRPPTPAGKPNSHVSVHHPSHDSVRR
jgi:hypothetical protein